jgi:macrolide transport system ATP-binding/permease protein
MGIGANTAIFSLIDAVLLRSLPVREPEKLVFFGRSEWGVSLNEFPNRDWGSFSYPFYRDARRLNEVFSDVAAAQLRPWSVHGAINTNGANGGQIRSASEWRSAPFAET